MQLSLRADEATPARIAKLKELLARHPGGHEVRLRLLDGPRTTVRPLDNGPRIAPNSALASELKTLLGPGCLT